MSFIQEMIAVAESKLGQKETKENQGPIVEWSIEKRQVVTDKKQVR